MNSILLLLLWHFFITPYFLKYCIRPKNFAGKIENLRQGRGMLSFYYLFVFLFVCIFVVLYFLLSFHSYKYFNVLI